MGEFERPRFGVPVTWRKTHLFIPFLGNLEGKVNRFRLFSFFLLLALILAAGPAYGQALPAPAPSAAAPVPINAVPFSSGPSYDSGWRSIAPGQALTLTHALNASADLLWVDLESRSFADGVTDRANGGADLGSGGARQGLFWHNLDETSITVECRPEETGLNAARVRIWRMPAPADYSSGWTALTPNVPQFFYHDLGGQADDLLVSLVYRDDSTLGVNNAGLGGMDEGALAALPGSRVGAQWYALTATSVSVLRLPEDPYAAEALVRIWKRPRADYDSGWLDISAAAPLTLTHGLNDRPDSLLVDVQYRSAQPGIGTNQLYEGGNEIGNQPLYGLQAGDQVGAVWRSLDSTSLVVERAAQDLFAAQVRVRLWDFWQPTLPAYDSGWTAIDQGKAQVFQHNLGLDPASTLVDLRFRSPAYGIGQRGLGGIDTAYAEQDGGYWQSLTADAITVVRRSEDVILPEVQVRLWSMPRPAYDSGWQAIAPGQTRTLTHDLGGDPSDYLLDLQFSDPELGTHIAGYGGYDMIDTDSEVEGRHLGANWHNLTASSLQVTRQADDTAISAVRVRLWHTAAPAYRAWVSVGQGQLPPPYDHGLSLAPQYLFVHLLFKNTDSMGLNQAFYGGAVIGSAALPGYFPGQEVGGYWRALTANSISIFRMLNDPVMDQAQIRLWALPLVVVYVPLVSK